MVNILDRIEATKEHFSKSDKIIYECIKNNYNIVTRKCTTIIDLAEYCNVSKSAILRFAKKLGYSGYSEFKYALVIKTQNNFPTNNEDNKIQSILDIYSEAILSINQFISEEEIQKLATMILKAKKVRICGSNRSGFTAMQLKFRLLNIKIETEVIMDPIQLDSLTSNYGYNEELYIFFSVMGGSRTPTNNYIKQCHDNNHKVVLITMNNNTLYKKYSDMFFIT